MEIIKYILLSLIQGIAEVLPISSSAHLIIFEHLFNIQNDNLAFEVLLHFASLLATLVYLRKEIARMLFGTYKYLVKKEQQSKESFMLIIYIIISMIPLIITSLIVKKLNINLHNLSLCGIMLIINSVILFNINHFQNQKLNLNKSLIIGIYQSIAIFPGISRSGSCLLGSNRAKLNLEDAKKYTFLLFLPSALGAFILESSNIKNLSIDNFQLFSILIITFLTTFLAFKIYEKIIKNNKISIFGYYTLFIGTLILLHQIIKGGI